MSQSWIRVMWNEFYLLHLFSLQHAMSLYYIDLISNLESLNIQSVCFVCFILTISQLLFGFMYSMNLNILIN